MEIIEEKINDVEVKPVVDRRKKSKVPFKGDEIIDIQYPNVVFLAKKGSGKSTALFRFLQARATKKYTTIVIFSSTYKQDDTYVNGINNMRGDGFRIIAFDSIYMTDAQTGKKINLVNELVSGLQKIDRSKKTRRSKTATGVGKMPIKDVTTERSVILSNGHSNDPVAKLRAKMTRSANIAVQAANVAQAPVPNDIDIEDIDESYGIFENEDFSTSDDFIVIFDDLGKSLRDKSVEQYLKINRHHHCQTVISTQHYADLDFGARGQIELWCIFSGLNDKFLQFVLQSTGLPVDFDTFKKIYQYATSDTANKPFLYIDVRGNGSFRKNFNTLLKIGEDATTHDEIADE